jgi:UDP-N-acetylmuramoylalanine--D-glutamate ligase
VTDYKKYFKGKRITIMGLGVLGRGLGYTKFLAECGAELIVTDMKTKEQLATSVKELKKYKNIEWVLGEHRMQDFKGVDIVIKNPGIPMDSIYIKEARKNKIEVEMDASLFAKLAPEVTLVGVTGTRGKTMTTMLVYEILKSAKKKVFLGGNIRGVATLPLLAKVKKGDIVVMELDSWQCAGFGEAKISPHVAVFTTFMRDHMNYYTSTGLSAGSAMKKYFTDKANIFKYQKKGDVLVIRPEMKKLIPKGINSKLIVANSKKLKDIDFQIPGAHQMENMACAVEVCKALGVSDAIIKKAVKNFKGVEGRLQYVKSVKGVKIYNDNNATTPEATSAGLEALGINTILICGGSDKNLDVKNLVKAINKYTKIVIVLPGKGTDRLINSKHNTEFINAKDLKDAVGKAMKVAVKGDTILFSPAFASFGMFTNEYDRNDQFMKIIKGLK